MNKLNHLAVIMDGNGRWAKNRGFIRTKGHEVGATKIELLCDFCTKKDIKELSLFAFSTENIKRPKSEVDFLFDLLKKYIDSKQEEFIKNGIRFNPFGDLSVFSDELSLKLNTLKEETKNNDRLIFNLGLNYGAKDEIVKTTKHLCKMVKEDKIALDDIDEKSFLNSLFIPTNVDLLIRTGKQKRISNFLLYQLAYAEIYFSNTLFPDISLGELEDIFDDFMKTERRFGRV